MQISSGTCTVTHGSSTVVASAFNNWLGAQSAIQTGSPVYFSLLGSTQVPRQVSAVTQPGVSASGNWELTLVAPWDQPSTTNPNGDQYVIQKDFTANLGLPLPAGGDLMWAQFLSRAFQTIDVAITGTAPFVPPATSIGGISTIHIQPSSTLYISDELDIPIGVEYEILAGGRLEIG
jgi:hypothetical protein